MKMLQRAAALVLSAAMAVGAGALAGCGPKEEDAALRMTVDINPSVEFILDEENRVLSVAALNDDGAILIAGEAFVGKTAEEAVRMVVSISAETGYLVKGELNADENGVTVSLTGDAAAADEAYRKIESAVNGFLEDSGIAAAVERGEALKLDALRAMVLAADPTLTEEAVSAMSETELLNALKAARIETAELLTEELRQAYLAAKEYEFTFAQKEATAEIIDGMDAAYQSIKSSYSELLEGYRKAIAAVEEARFDAFASQDSAYQRAMHALRDAKTALLKQKNLVAQMEEGMEKDAAMIVLAAKEAAYEAAEKALSASAALADKALEGVISAMKKAEEGLTALEAELPEEIASQLREQAESIQDKMNAAKDGAFERFEEAHGEEIEAVKRALEERKQALVEANREA